MKAATGMLNRQLQTNESVSAKIKNVFVFFYFSTKFDFKRADIRQQERRIK